MIEEPWSEFGERRPESVGRRCRFSSFWIVDLSSCYVTAIRQRTSVVRLAARTDAQV